MASNNTGWRCRECLFNGTTVNCATATNMKSHLATHGYGPWRCTGCNYIGRRRLVVPRQCSSDLQNLTDHAQGGSHSPSPCYWRNWSGFLPRPSSEHSHQSRGSRMPPSSPKSMDGSDCSTSPSSSCACSNCCYNSTSSASSARSPCPSYRSTRPSTSQWPGLCESKEGGISTCHK